MSGTIVYWHFSKWPPRQEKKILNMKDTGTNATANYFKCEIYTQYDI